MEQVSAEAYEPRTLGERLTYDRDLDEAENVLDAADAWRAINPDRWHTPPETYVAS